MVQARHGCVGTILLKQAVNPILPSSAALVVDQAHHPLFGRSFTKRVGTVGHRRNQLSRRSARSICAVALSMSASAPVVAAMSTSSKWATLGSWSRRRRVVAKAEHTAARASALRRYLAQEGRMQGPIPLRKDLLRPLRYGKPHQGVSGRPVCRPHVDGHHARQPIAPVVCVDGLCAGVRLAKRGIPKGCAVVQNRLCSVYPVQAMIHRHFSSKTCRAPTANIVT
jgi:hypothetical protein